MYRDLQRPPLDVDGLRRSLTTGPRASWSALEVVGETGSTNADLLARAASADRPESLDRSVLLAEQQTAARGRRDRAFGCEPQSQILVSVLLHLPGVRVERLGWLPLLAGLAATDVLRDIAEVPAALKWPNDVLIGGRKVAGILAEMAATGPGAAPGAGPGGGHLAVPLVVVGIGLNVSQEQDALPVPTATSLSAEGAACRDRNVLVRGLLRGLADRVHRWHGLGGEPGPFAAEYESVCDTLGREVRALLPGGAELRGTAVGVDDAGRLLIDDETGVRRAVSAGDVEHVRPGRGPAGARRGGS